MEAETTLRDDIRRLRGSLSRQRLTIFLVLMAALAGAVALIVLPEPLYRASTKLVVGQRGALFDPNVESGSVADSFTQTMADLLDSDIVATGTIQRLKLKTSSRELREQLSVSLRPSTTVIRVSYVDSSRARSRRVLTGVTTVFGELVGQRFAAGAGAGAGAGAEAASPLTVTVFDPAHVEEQVRPRPVRTLVLAAGLGLVIAVLTALVRDQLQQQRPARPLVEDARNLRPSPPLPPSAPPVRAAAAPPPSPPRPAPPPAPAPPAVTCPSPNGPSGTQSPAPAPGQEPKGDVAPQRAGEGTQEPPSPRPARPPGSGSVAPPWH